MKPDKNNQARSIGFYALLLVIVMAVVFTMTKSEEEEDPVIYSQIVDLFKSERVESFVLKDSVITLKVRPENGEGELETMEYEAYSFSLFYNDLADLIAEQYD